MKPAIMRRSGRTSTLLVRRESHIPMSTAGSILLILQAILPCVLYLPSTVPLCVTIEGGTNVSKSPSIEHASQVLLPLLSTKLGIHPIGVVVHKRGWSAGRSVVGSVTFEITPLKKGNTLPAFQFIHRGYLEKVHISVIAPADGSRQCIMTEAFKQLGDAMPGTELLLAVDEDSGHSQHIYLLLVAEMSSGFRLGRDCLYGRNASKALKIKSEHRARDEDRTMVHRVVAELQRELAWEGCVDEYLEDQLVVFQALAHGTSEVNAGTGRPASLHTKTAQWVAEQVLGIGFRGSKGAGVSFRVGGVSEERTETLEDDDIQRIAHLSVCKT